MACFFGNSEAQEKENRLNSEITSLKKEILSLKRENEELQSQLSSPPSPTPSGGNDNEYETAELKQQLTDISEERDKLLESQQRAKEDIQKLRDQIIKLEDNNASQSTSHYNNDESQSGLIEELRAENSMLAASQKLLKEKDKKNQQEIDSLKKQLSEANTNNNSNANDDDQKQSPPKSPRKKNRKYNLNKIDDQIEVLYSEKAKLKSMILIMKPQYIQKSDNEYRDFSFLQFLETSLSDKVIDQLFSKFKSDTVDGKQLVSLLTLSVIIYKVKLHKMRTGSTDKPKMDSASIKQSVEHFTAWIIRNYGTKSNDKKKITVRNDNGETINGEYTICSAKFDKKAFGNDVKIWASKYIDDDGYIDLQSS
mmetsp:Transcript_47958/g.43022  ORF Transcript_47958/g.43022 Transcript_47958/m.43022 type:complete len:367 (+) Transcript_47958:32-1132(+)|eukprot:CAMPEP_0201582468 /NCGR_PEP_ID=MMETSP0190_2-20130828/85641_1 /ASSEMBLY_ACC=CAM_ASM_000263 /TAXON_ID=37353 /ORGANISM="Rosalina sp." /LENGTH=366 /DNA_ID=CAMNT_0048022445 /DNA_START=27 /DNA_END=1127 /DNA_ORIENTATION=+